MSADKKTLDGLRIDRRHRPASTFNAWWIVVVVFLVAIGLGIAWWLQRPRPIPVQVFEVRPPSSNDQQTLLNASGYVTARRQATVSSKVTGKVEEVLIEEGMHVKEGQVLARLDHSNVEANLKLAEAQSDSARKALAETRANLAQADREFKRVSELAAGKIASQSDLDRAEAAAKSLQARLERQQADVAVAEREVALWQQQMEDTIIRAPFSGVVVSKNAQPGEMISPISAGGGYTRTGICTIVDMNSLEIEVDVNESYINRVKEDQPVEATLDSYPDWRIPAKVIAIIPTADRQKATVKVRVGFDKLDPRILPDMGVKVAFQSGGEKPAAQSGVAVPKEAVRRVDGRDIVWVVKDGKVERRAVTVGSERSGQVTIAAGLSGGERVVVEGPGNLTNGARVTEEKE